MYHKYIYPVHTWCDFLLTKDASHQFSALKHLPGRWAAKQVQMQITELDAIVIGAGQAGLCEAYYLKQSGLHYEVLEKSDSCGHSWSAHRWDSFRLVTENSLCRLPEFPCTEIGEPLDGFMHRDRIVEYLEQFRKRNQLQVSFGQAAVSVTRGWQDRWVVLTSSGRWLRALNVVVAVGGWMRTVNI